MDNFDKIIKQKVEQFDVPYNEAHWAEMDGKLNSIRATKVKKNIFGSAAIIAAVAISGYFIFTNNETKAVDDNKLIAEGKTTEVITNEKDVDPTQKDVASNNNEVINKNQVIEKLALEENEIAKIEENEIEDEIISDYPSNNIKEDNNSIDNVVVNNKAPNANFIVYNNRPCLGEGVKFESLEDDQPVSYTWNFGDGTISHETNPTHTYKESLTYQVTLTLLNRQTGKEYTSIQQDAVTILPFPEIAFTYIEESKKHDDNALKYPYTQFNVKNPDKKSTYQWTFGNEENSTSVKAKTIYENKGSFVVKLVVTNSYGCENSTKKKVSIKNGATLYTPNAFTPNTDGENDNFIPISLLEWDIQFEMTIVDVFGNHVYKTSDRNEPWNGKMNNSGQVLDKGVYLWQVVTYDAEGTPHQHSGKINLVK